MTTRILIAVTHLLGSGHLVRARHLARALAGAGHAVTLASGGMPLRTEVDEPFAFVQLPPVKVEGVDFRNLFDEAGQPIDAARRANRQARLAELVATTRPEIVVTEHFPFGRRQLADEFLGLIAAARAATPQVLVLSSIRDVLVAPRADRVAEVEARLDAHFDAVLVHGDPDFLPLEASWPVSPGLAAKLRYTGYLAEPSLFRSAGNHGNGEILVSGGGSAAALPLFRLCITTAKLVGSDRPWRILVGRGTSEADFAGLAASAPSHVAVEWARPDFPALLAACALSISQAGYNTVLDLVDAGRPAIVVPFDAGNETEQVIRAQAMARAGLARCLRLWEGEPLPPEMLSQAVSEALLSTPAAGIALARDGAARTVAVVEALPARR
jgi:predicted glycosyltransferase